MEQALVFASIILGVAVSDLVVSLHRLLRTDKLVRWHWAQPWFALLVLLLNLMIWWSIVGQPEREMTIGAFVPVVVQLILLALLTIAALPDHVPADGIDMADFYQANRRYQWLLLALNLLCSMAIDVAEHQREGASLGTAIFNESEDGFIMLVMIGMAFARNWWLVALGLAFLSAGPIGWMSRSIG